MGASAAERQRVFYLEDGHSAARREGNYDEPRTRVRVRQERQAGEVERRKVRRLLFLCSFLMLGAVTIYLYLNPWLLD